MISVSREKCFKLIKNLTKKEALEKLEDLKEEFTDRCEFEDEDPLNPLMIDILEQKIEVLSNIIDNAIYDRNGVIVNYINF